MQKANYIILFMLVSNICFSQDDTLEKISTDSLQQIVYGKWDIKEWHCWEPDYNDTITKELYFYKDTAIYTEIYKNKVIKQQIGTFSISTFYSSYVIEINIDDPDYIYPYNKINISTEHPGLNEFVTSWWEEFYYKSEKRGSIYKGMYVFFRKE
jgi:hypothetical protein